MITGKKVLLSRYKVAKATKVGDIVRCVSCNTSFNKTNYQQVFCKSKGGTICKDNYWNNVTPTKRNNKTRISPASAAWMAMNDTPVVLGFGTSQREIDRLDREQNSLEYGSSEHGDVLVARCEFCECLNCRCDGYVW